jgi:uncharacterized membrane protein
MRSPTIDSLRGLAIIGMILFHLNYLLENVFVRDIIPLGDIFWNLLGPSVAIVFISLAGIVSVLSADGKSMSQIMRKTLGRTSVLAICALTITLVTSLFIPSETISWGILHFLALASILGLITLRTGYLTLLLGIIALIVPHLSFSLPPSHTLIPL